ncbi:MAG: hypothetical protein ACJ74R_01410 [Gaiellaceae bacterium]
MRRLVFAVAACMTVVTAFAMTASAADVKITDRPYYRHDTPDTPAVGDVTIVSCSNDAPGATAGGERQQNEPAAAVDPSQPMHMTAGSNDYCSVPTTTDAYGGFYWSSDHGVNWKDSLLPGYPTDSSAEGSNCAISPQHCLVINTGDPVQAFDRWGHVFYGVIGFNRAKPSNGSIFAARYDWPSGAPNPDYKWTRLVARGTPTGLTGKFEDKVQIEVDRSMAPSGGTADRPWGNVYICWAQFLGGNGNNGVWFSRSIDGGSTYSNPQKISEGVHGSQFCDIAVTGNGTVYVTWRQFETSRGHQVDAVVVNKSTNAGASFGKPQIVTPFIHWDVGDLAGVPADEREEAMEEACEEGDGIDCAEREHEESGPGRDQTPTRDCGDGPFVCESGYVFFREDSQTRITADPTDNTPQGRNAAYIVYNATVPGTEVSTGTSYGTVEPGIGSRGALYFTRTLDGSGWSTPKLVSTAATGHQFFPDIDANAGKIHVMWQDSRNDTAHGLSGDYRTVPIANIQVASNPPGSISTGDDVGVQTFYNVSADRGGSFLATDTLVSTSAQMPQYEQFGARDIPFFGDYNSISAVGNTVLIDWTDLRETLPGTDPRYPPPPTPSDGTDGFDVLQCPPATIASPTCPNAGGLDQNIFGAVLP